MLRMYPLFALLITSGFAIAAPARAATTIASASSYEVSQSISHPDAASATITRQGPNAPGESAAASSAALGGLAGMVRTKGCGFESNGFQQVCNQAGMTSSFTDTVQVLAAVPHGTAVQFQLTLDLAGSIDGIGGYSYQALGSLNLVSRSIIGGTGGTVQTRSDFSIADNRVWTVTLFVGANYELYSSLTASLINRYCAGGSSDCVPSATTWEMVLLASSMLRMELLTTGIDGVRLVGRGGHDYLMPPLGVTGGEPAAARFGPPYPQPSRGSVRLSLEMPAAAFVDVGVYDLAGRRVATIGSGELAAGSHVLRWDARDAEGRGRSGMFFVRARGAGLELSKRVVIVR